MLPRTLSFTVVGIVAFSGIASAATKYTPALSKNSTDFFNCRLVNAGSVPIDADVQIIDSNGNLLNQTTITNLSAGDTASGSYSGTSTIGYCKVDGSFSRKRVLVTFCVVSGSRCEVSVGDPGL